MNVKPAVHRALAPIVYGDTVSIVPRPVANFWPERNFLKRLLKRLRVDCVFDVGANIGQFARELRLVGYQGLTVSVEPNPEAHATLARKARRDRRWETYNLALGDHPGRAALNVMSQSVYSSLKSPSTEESSSHADANTVVNKVEVEVSTLEELYRRLKARHGFARPFLKLDTQGSDVDVFHGAGATIAEFVGLVSEVPLKRIYSNVPSWTETLEVYQEAGFDVAGLYPVADDGELPIEFNCYMVRQPLPH